MKMIAVLLMTVFSFSAFAQTQLECANGNSHLLLNMADSTVQCTIVDASGVEDATGTLNCTGPLESAYSCTGKLNMLDSKDQISVQLVIPETTLQMSAGPVVLDGYNYTCSAKK